MERRSEALPKKEASLPGAALVSFLKETKGVTTWTVCDLTKFLNTGAATGKQALPILEMQGYVKPTGSKRKMNT
jgi:hypothetical protein